MFSREHPVGVGKFRKGKQMTEKKFLTVREVAATGILTEYSIRLMLKQKKIPAIYINRKALINYPLLLEALDKQSLQHTE